MNESVNTRIAGCKLTKIVNCIFFFFRSLIHEPYNIINNLRAASPKYQLDLEIAKKSNFFKLAQNEALRALVKKIMFLARFYQKQKKVRNFFVVSMPQISQNRSKMSGVFVNSTVKLFITN